MSNVMGRPRRSQKIVRRRTTLNPKDRMAAQKERAQWENVDARVEPRPETALCVSLLANSRADLVKLADASVRLKQAREAARKALAWMYREDAGLPFDVVATAVGREPNGLREAMLKGIDDNLVRMCMGGINWNCPVCGSRH